MEAGKERESRSYEDGLINIHRPTYVHLPLIIRSLNLQGWEGAVRSVAASGAEIRRATKNNSAMKSNPPTTHHLTSSPAHRRPPPNPPPWPLPVTRPGISSSSPSPS